MALPTSTMLNGYLAQLCEKTGITRAEVALYQRGKLVYGSAGELESGRVPFEFDVGCLNKFLISLACIQLSMRGGIALGAPIHHYLPEFSASKIGHTATVSHLLNHTCGYRGPSVANSTFASWSELCEYIRSAQQLFAPGTVFNYEHSGYALAGEIVRRISGQSVQSFVLEYTLSQAPKIGGIEVDGALSEPLTELANSRLVIARHHESLWYLDLIATIPDLAILGASLLDGALGGIHRLAHQSIPVLRAAHVTGQMEDAPIRYGLGCAVYPGGWLGHNGTSAEHTVCLRFLAELDTVIAIGINRPNSTVRNFLLTSMVRGVASFENGSLEKDDDIEEALFLDGELEGHYIGGTSDLSASVHRSGNSLSCVVVDDSASVDFSIPIVQKLTHVSPLEGAAPIRFFREPTEGIPCMMAGLHVLTKKGVNTCHWGST